MKITKAYILDYDGVVAESNQIKTNAFKELFKQEKESYVEEFIKYHKENEGISRLEKIKYFYKNYLREEISKKQLDSMAKEFSNIVVEKVITCKKVNGIDKFLKKYFKKVDFFISTGTPTKEIISILELTKMKHYFKLVLGSPDSKNSHIAQILNQYKLKPKEITFIGDSKTDLEAAKSSNLNFILRLHEHNKELNLAFKGDTISDFGELIKILDS